MPPLGASSSPRLRLACASSRVAFLLLSVATVARRLAIWLLTSSMACSSLKRLARAWATRPRTWAWAAARSASAAATAAFLIVDLNLVRFLVELDQQVPLLHAVVVVHQDLGHLAGDAGSHEGHVAVDVGVVGGNRVQRRHHPGNQEVAADRQADHDRRQQQPFSPAVRGGPADGSGRGATTDMLVAQQVRRAEWPGRSMWRANPSLPPARQGRDGPALLPSKFQRFDVLCPPFWSSSFLPSPANARFSGQNMPPG